VSDLPLPYDPAMDKQVSRATGYEIARHRTIFEGVCPSCAGKQKAGE
jgi:Fur family ferric uptake transcriptional regulator